MIWSDLDYLIDLLAALALLSGPCTSRCLYRFRRTSFLPAREAYKRFCLVTPRSAGTVPVHLRNSAKVFNRSCKQSHGMLPGSCIPAAGVNRFNTTNAHGHICNLQPMTVLPK
jgi:hypothetical protein